MKRAALLVLRFAGSVAGLLEWMCFGEFRKLEALPPEGCYRGKFCEIQFVKIGHDDLAGNADVGDPRCGSQCKWSRGTPCQQPLIGRKSFHGPMFAP